MKSAVQRGQVLLKKKEQRLRQLESSLVEEVAAAYSWRNLACKECGGREEQILGGRSSFHRSFLSRIQSRKKPASCQGVVVAKPIRMLRAGQKACSE